MRSQTVSIARSDQHEFKKFAALTSVVFLSALLLLLPISNANAQSAAETQSINQVNALLTSAHKAAGDQSALTAVVKRHFAIGTWTNALLGKQKSKFSSGQASEFERLFSAYTAKQYFKQFGGAGGSSGVVTQARTVRGDVLVTSRIPSKNRTFTVVWRMRVIGGKPRVIDYSTGGISNVVLRRSEFQSKVKQSGPESLNSFLKQFIAS